MSKRNALACAVILVLTGPTSAVLTAASPKAPQIETRKSQQEQELEDRQQKLANKQRQEQIKKDTEKLFQLASELKDAVGKSNENMLSLDVVKKAEEVEKLAKKVKEQMREGSGRQNNELPPIDMRRSGPP